MKPDYSLYVITDRKLMTSETVEKSVELAVSGGAGIIQLREKNMESGEFYRTALKIKEILKGTEVPLIINDRLDVALAANADGVHIGQKDIPLPVVRKILGKDKIIGVSAATVSEAIQAEKDGADYLGTGAVFITNTKNNTRSVSYDLLKEITSSVNIPVVAIGGINKDNAIKLKGSGISGIAVISAVIAQADINKAAKNMLALSKEIKNEL